MRLTQDAIWRLGGAIVGQTALFTALLLFFGWARTQATFAYFGVDLSLLDLSTTDYVLRSVNSAYDPLLKLGLVALAAVWLHARLTRAPARAEWTRRVRLGAAGAGWLLLAIGVSALLWSGWADRLGSWVPDDPALGFAWLPATLAAAFALLGFAGTLPGGRAATVSPRSVFVLVALFVMSLFWTVSLLAVHDGHARALEIERRLPSATEVVLLTRDSPVIRGPGVVKADLRLADRRHPYGRYRQSYSGLRLLIHAAGKYFLLPAGWRHGRDRVFEVPDDDQVRVELIAR